jgi:hypothetical protein
LNYIPPEDRLETLPFMQAELTFILPGWVFKFQCMVYEKSIIWTEKGKIMKLMTFCGENKR